MICKTAICERISIAVAIFLSVGVRPALAAVRLAAPFGEHMVLPQGVPVPIWGTGAPGGDSVRLSFNGQNVTAISDWEGRWMVTLAPMKAGGPYQLLIEVGGRGPVIASAAANSRGGAELNDVVVGEVRIFRRQLNPLLATGSTTKNSPQDDTVKRSAWVRLYKNPMRTGNGADSGEWTVASLESRRTISADLYSFGSEIHERLNVPVGVIEVDP